MLNAYGSYQFPEDWVIRVDYDSSNNPIYVGAAPPNSSTSDAEWLIYKLTWTNGNMTLKQTASGPWDSRTILGYV